MKILHIADLHLVNKDGDLKKHQNEIVERFIDFIKDVTDVDFSLSAHKVDQLLITGDLVNGKSVGNTISTEVIDHACETLHSIMAALNICDVRNVHIVPGNHDLLRTDDDDINVPAFSWEQKNRRFDKFFWAFCDKFYGSAHNPWNDGHGNKYCTLEKRIDSKKQSDAVGFVYINSALECIHSDVDLTTTLNLHPDVFSLLSNITSDIDHIFLLAHHPLSWISEASKTQLNTSLEHLHDDKHRFYWMCGHNHDTDAGNLNKFIGNPPIAIGSFLGVHGQYYESPDFAIYDTLDENFPLRVYRFLNHLNRPLDKNGKPLGGWKLIHITGENTVPIGSRVSFYFSQMYSGC